MSIFAGHRLSPLLYINILVVASLCAYVYTVHTRSAFACPATGYSQDRYLAYCSATEYGDFDHGAFWFDMVPGVRSKLLSADALFLGNSRMQFGFSGEPTQQWFDAAGATHYLMGFAYWENVVFESALLKKFAPRPKVLIVNADLFFTSTETEPAKTVMHESAARRNYGRKGFWQGPHRHICGTFPVLCGNNESFYRSVSTGHYVRRGGKVEANPVSDDPSIDQVELDGYTSVAAAFLATVPLDRSCVLFTMVPTQGTKRIQAQVLAQRLNVKLIAPELPGLTMFDHSHLDAPSAERWARVFFEQADPELRHCLGAASAR